jgi:YHYH protein
MTWRRSAKRIAILGGFAGASLAACLATFGTGTALPSNHAKATATVASGDPDLTSLPLGDGKTTTTSPQRGYLYECQRLSGGGGAQTNGSWIHGSTYDLTQKAIVDGSVDWPTATFKKRVKGSKLRLRGNGLPKHTTGVYPIASSDDAYQVDRNPNRISAYGLSARFATKPKYHATPSCVGGQVGVMTSGVELFSAVDAEDRDAVAHEVQDSCSGHPQQSGVYHYHGLPACIGTGASNKQSKLIGWALDGFPIYGPRGKGGRYLSNADLDECHGTISKVNYLGEKRRMFHYVANYEFPYTVGCYRGTAISGTGTGSGGGAPTGPPPP